MQIIVSQTMEPEVNLAQEITFLTEYTSKEILFLYINAPSVIVGRNQLPEAEADLSYCTQHNIPVIKRVSGGGTVYHDLGNVNYAFICNAENGKALDRNFLAPIVAALSSFGIAASVGARKELLVDGKKISGTASHISRGRQLFHGTLLFDTDLSHLHHVLSGDKSLRGKHVASVPSEVINISGLLEQKITAPQFMERLAYFFERYFNTPSL